MLKPFLPLLLLSFNALSCGDKTDDFFPFATKIIDEDELTSELKVFEILSPIQKDDKYLNGVVARVSGEFEISLDIFESGT